MRLPSSSHPPPPPSPPGKPMPPWGSGLSAPTLPQQPLLAPPAAGNAVLPPPANAAGWPPRGGPRLSPGSWRERREALGEVCITPPPGEEGDPTQAFIEGGRCRSDAPLRQRGGPEEETARICAASPSTHGGHCPQKRRCRHLGSVAQLHRPPGLAQAPASQPTWLRPCRRTQPPRRRVRQQGHDRRKTSPHKAVRGSGGRNAAPPTRKGGTPLLAANDIARVQALITIALFPARCRTVELTRPRVNPVPELPAPN